MRRLRKLAALSPAELAELLQAQWALLHAQGLCVLRPVGAFVSPAAPAGDLSREEPSEVRWEEAARIALAVRRAAEHGLFRPACLVRSIALTRLLERHGIPGSQLRVGVRREGERFAAHAWVEYGGRVLGDQEERVSRYTPIPNVEVLP